MDVVDTPKKLQVWLRQKPAIVSAAIALRIALRVVPLAFNAKALEHRPAHSTTIVPLFRALSLSWIAANNPRLGLSQVDSLVAGYSDAIYTANIYLDYSNNPVPELPTFLDFDIARALFAAAYALDASLEASYATNAQGFTVSEVNSSASHCAGDAALVATSQEFFARRAKGISQVYSPISNRKNHVLAFTLDADWVERQSESRLEVSRLLCRPLWPDPRLTPEKIESEKAVHLLRTDSNGSKLWSNWYQRRINGEEGSFAMSTAHNADIERRLLTATNDWWAREPTQVNADIALWLAELSSPITDPLRQLESNPDWPGDLPADPQTSDAVRFIEDEAGRAVIDSQAGDDALRTDARSIERHASARKRAAAAAELLRGHNQGDYLSSYARDAFDALGDDIASGDLAETVLLANRLRQGAAAHALAGPRDDLQPLPPDLARSVEDLVDALNLHIGQQPVLAAMDVAALGPDAEPVLASPDDVATLLEDVEAADAIEARTRDYIHIVAEMAPDVPDPANRQSRRLGLTMANLGRFFVSKISEHRILLSTFPAGAVAGVAVAAGGLTGAGGVAFAFGALCTNMKKHPDIWMNLAGPSPASQANMRKVLDFLERYWPSASAMDMDAPKD